MSLSNTKMIDAEDLIKARETLKKICVKILEKQNEQTRKD